MCLKEKVEDNKIKKGQPVNKIWQGPWVEDENGKKHPDINGDGIINTAYLPNGPGGYGLFQVTIGPKLPDGKIINEGFITRSQIWNWQQNCDRAIKELQGKKVVAADLLKDLNATFKDKYGNVKLPETFTKLKDPLDATVMTYYNGMYGGQITQVGVNVEGGGSKKRPSCWQPHLSPTKEKDRKGNIIFVPEWIFLKNHEDYVRKVYQFIQNP